MLDFIKYNGVLKMSFKNGDTVEVICGGRYQGRVGEVVGRDDYLMSESVYTIKYDTMVGQGQFPESYLKLAGRPIMVYLDELQFLDANVELMVESLLRICGCEEVWQHPDGRRIFTVKKKPDDVQVAGIRWMTYEPIFNPHPKPL